MASKIAMELFPGASSLEPSAFLQGRDLRDFQIGAKNASGQGTHNRLAVPWAGAAYTLVNGSWRKIMGRPGALSGPEMERRYPNITSTWRAFARAQGRRNSSPGSFNALVADLRRVAANIGSQGRQSEGEGISLRALKSQAKRGGTIEELPTAGGE